MRKKVGRDGIGPFRTGQQSSDDVVVATVAHEASRPRSAEGTPPTLVLRATGNDEESNFCDGSTVFGGGDQGTPGTANVQCGGTTAGMCNMGGTLRPIVKPTALELMLYGDPWERAVEVADRRLSRRRSA